MKETKNTTWKQKSNSTESLKSEINYIFKSAKKNKTPFKDILNSIKLRVYDSSKYKTLPMYIRASINGYIDANYQIMYDYIEWCHWYNGIFVGSKLIYDNKFKQSLVNSHYVYKNTQKIYS